MPWELNFSIVSSMQSQTLESYSPPHHSRYSCGKGHKPTGPRTKVHRPSEPPMSISLRPFEFSIRIPQCVAPITINGVQRIVIRHLPGATDPLGALGMPPFGRLPINPIGSIKLRGLDSTYSCKLQPSINTIGSAELLSISAAHDPLFFLRCLDFF